MSEKLKDYFTSREAAERLGVAVSTIQLWTNNGLLRAWTTGGGHRRITRSSIETMLSQQQTDSGELKTEQQLTVVVVEDDEQQLRLYKKLFHGWNMNINVITAKDGYEGLIKIGCALPDVIITDLMMPNMSGFQMVRALKEMPELKHSLIIVVTGLEQNEIKIRGGLPEDIQIFTKPFSVEGLKSLLLDKTGVQAA
jgi:excisionase family DNA binding protein